MSLKRSCALMAVILVRWLDVVLQHPETLGFKLPCFFSFCPLQGCLPSELTHWIWHVDRLEGETYGKRQGYQPTLDRHALLLHQWIERYVKLIDSHLNVMFRSCNTVLHWSLFLRGRNWPPISLTVQYNQRKIYHWSITFSWFRK